MAYENQSRAAADMASDVANAAGRQIGLVADKTAEVAKQAGAKANELAGEAKSAIDKSLSSQPMATLGMAVVAGFVLGALWKS